MTYRRLSSYLRRCSGSSRMSAMALMRLICNSAAWRRSAPICWSGCSRRESVRCAFRMSWGDADALNPSSSYKFIDGEFIASALGTSLAQQLLTGAKFTGSTRPFSLMPSAPRPDCGVSGAQELFGRPGAAGPTNSASGSRSALPATTRCEKRHMRRKRSRPAPSPVLLRWLELPKGGRTDRDDGKEVARPASHA